MDDPSKPPVVAAVSLDDPEVLGGIWDRFRAGEVVPCPVEGSPFALSVDGAAGVYRFVCTASGHASPWFEAGIDALHVRGQAPASMRGGAIDE